MTDTRRLIGRVALVTGAGSPTGIGFASARILAREGARVAIASTTARIHERVGELEAEGYEAAGFTGDLTDAAQARALIEGVVGRFGRLDILVNNAGMVSVGSEQEDYELADMPEEAWDFGIAINLKTTFNVTQAALPELVERGWGRIVNVSSVTGPLVSAAGSTAYSAAKAGVDGMMRSLAIEVGRRGVTVNSVAPGWIGTASSLPSEIVAGGYTPVGRPGTAEEVGEVVGFLASPGASYVTGQSIVVDGGNIIQEYKGPEN